MITLDEITLDDIKTKAAHLKVMGAYVQAPTPSIVGLSEDEVIASNDASALYPTTIIHQNIGFDTLRHRFYDPGIVESVIKLLVNVFENKNDQPQIIEQALNGFQNALEQVLKDFFKRKTVPKKNEFREFTLVYYTHLLKKIFKYDGKLEDIFKPIDNNTYFLLKSYLFPILEMVSWLSPQNRGYNQLTISRIGNK
jgi:DNA polymerase elongation subunit (family B)